MKARLHHLAMCFVAWFFEDMHPTREELGARMSPSRYAELRTRQIHTHVDAAPRVLPGVLAAVATGLVSILFATQLAYGWSL